MPLSPLATQTAPDSSGYNGSRLVNVFVHPAEGKSPAVLFCRGGLTANADTGTGAPVRAVEKMAGVLYAVSGGSVWKVTGGTATNVGTVSDGTTYMASNGAQLAIVANENYYVCDGSTTTAYTTGAVDIPRGVAFMDGYFIVIGQVAGRDDGFTISDIDDATTFDAAEFAFAENNPDALTGVIVDHNELWMFGSDTVQPFYNSGDTFPFAPNKGALIEEGCVSGLSLAKADNAVFWITPDGKVARSFGAGPEWVSTPEIAEALRSSTIVGAFTFAERGHEFYAIARDGDTTFVYDITTGFWHERTAGTGYSAWAPRCGIDIGGVEYYGTATGVIATSSATTYEDFGAVISAEVTTPLTENSGNNYRVSRVHIDIATGGVDIGRNAQAMLQTTRDGVNWSPEKWRDLGGASAYSKRAAWHSLGMFREGAIRVRVTDGVPRDIVGMAVQANG